MMRAARGLTVARVRIGVLWRGVVWRSVVWCGVVCCALACSDEAPPNDEPIAPNANLRAAVESPPAPPADQPRFGYDTHGRLARAKGLVHGFEVPRALKLVETRPDYLELEIRAPMESLLEFWSGHDRRTKRPFIARGYQVDVDKNGFEVRHTDGSLNRLNLPSKYREAHVFVTEKGGRMHTVRIHKPRTDEAGVPAPDRFVPRLGENARPSPSPSAAASAKTPPGVPAAAPTQKKKARAASSARTGSGSTPEQRRAARIQHWNGHNDRSGWHRTRRSQSVRNDVQRWQRENPGKKFVD